VPLGAAHLTEQAHGSRILRLDKDDDVILLMLLRRSRRGAVGIPFRQRRIGVLGVPVPIAIVRVLAEKGADDVTQFFATRRPIISR
jgi:hypothetical protein